MRKSLGELIDIRIRDLREDLDITQKEVAIYLKCDQSLYSKYERGEREIPLKIIIKLAFFFNTNIDYLLGLTDVKEPYSKRVDISMFINEHIK